MPRAVVYLRVSTEDQADSGLGIEAQRAAARACAQRLGLDVAGEHTDAGLSGTEPIRRRPALLAAVAELGKGDALIVAKRDRIGRLDPLDMAMIEAAVRRSGARIVSAAGEGTDDDSPSNVLMRRIVDAFAEYEALVIKARTRAALAAKRARGERAGQLPYGLRLAADGVGVVEDRAERSAVEAVRRWRSEGWTLRRIAAQLDALMVPTKRGRPWHPATVADLLKRGRDEGTD